MNLRIVLTVLVSGFLLHVLCEEIPSNGTSDSGDTVTAGYVSALANGVMKSSEAVTVTTSSSTTEKVRTFQDEEKEIVNFVNSILRQLLPYAVRRSSSSFSPSCMTAMLRMFTGMRKLKGWTLKMLDSTGKPAAGILEGTSYSLGSYDQCLDVSVTRKGQAALTEEEEDFRGQYCVIRLQQRQPIISAARGYHQGTVSSKELGKLKEMIDVAPFSSIIPDYMSHFLGVCLPSTCNGSDITEILQNIPYPGEAFLEKCESKTHMEVDITHRVVIGIFCLLAALAAVGTMVDKLLQFYSEKNREQYMKSVCVSVIVSVSVCSNTRKLLQRIQNDSIERPDWRSIRGIVFGTVVCLIIHHTYLPPFATFTRQASNLGNLRRYFDEPSFALVVCLPVVIETLFVCYGFALSNKLWKSSWKKPSMNFTILQILISSYFRLVIPVLFCLGIIVLLPLLGSGPFWGDIYQPTVENCKRNWPALLGMYSNFLRAEDQCFPHIWYASCLMQILIPSVLLLWIISRWRRIGILLTLGSIIACNVAVGGLSIAGQLPPAYVEYFTESKTNYFWQVNYALPLSHFSSFNIGMLLGIFVAKKTRLRMNFLSCILGWFASVTVTVGVCFFLLYAYKGPLSADVLCSAVYAAFHRTAFSLGIAWIILSCSYGYGGSISSLLSWSVWDPLYKLSYFAYLLHMVIIAFHMGTAREKFSYSHSEMIMRAISYIVLSFFAAYICHIVTEMPLRALQVSLSPSKSDQVTISTVSSNGRPKESRNVSWPPAYNNNNNNGSLNNVVTVRPANGYTTQ